MAEKHCWGCGSLNDQGLRIKSRWSPDGTRAVCTWHPQPHHGAGPQGILNGGIIATLIDCHSICTAVAAAYREEGRPIGEGEAIWYATASLLVRYLLPTPINHPVELRAAVREMKRKKTVLECSLHSNGKERARAEVIAVRVPTAWRWGESL